MTSDPGRRYAGAVLALTAGLLVSAAPSAAAGPAGEVGASGLGDPLFPRAGNGSYEVGRYRINLAYRPASGRLRARARLDATARLTDPANGVLARFNLDFRGPRIRSVRVDGEPAGFTRRGPELVVTPDTPVADGAAFRVVVRYAGRPQPVTDPDGSREGWIRTADGAVALGEPLGSTSWFPSNNHPTDKAAYRIALATPPGTLGISNGNLVDRRSTRRRTVTVWRQDEPMASYLATVAIGRFRLDRRAVGGERYLAAIDRRLGADTDTRLRRRTRSAHAFMRGVAGAYPFSATGGTVDPASIGYALETQTRPYYPDSPSTDLVVHEISHQWYANSVSPAAWDEIWLNEGFATYMEWLFVERHGGRSAARTFDALYAAHGAGDTSFWNPPPASPGSSSNLFATSMYVRGAMALQVLREEIGDGNFFALLEDWATTNRYGNVTTDDLRTAIAEATGAGVPPLFEDWISAPGKPDAP